MSGELSSLKPEVKKVKPQFTYENRGYDSFIENGFQLPDSASQVPGNGKEIFYLKLI